MADCQKTSRTCGTDIILSGKILFFSGIPKIIFPPASLKLLSPFLLLLCASLATTGHALESALELRDIYAQTVDRKLILPDAEQRYYAGLLLFHLKKAELGHLPAQYLLVVDRNPHVQAALLFWLAEDERVELIGASPVSTGKKGGYDYFETPVGVFENSINNPDFRAEGTKNRLGLMGYGNKGMRVYDFGWVTARKSWIAEVGSMRLQLHATDPGLEARLGTAQSRGCIRIPATLNKLLDRYGVLDSPYESAVHNKQLQQTLDPLRIKHPWYGRFMIVVDSRRTSRPSWTFIQDFHFQKAAPE